MSDEAEDRSDHQRNAVVKMQRFKSGTDQIPLDFEEAPDEWKRACIDVLKDYQAEKAKHQRSGKYGARKLRDDIMFGYDIYQGNELRGRDSRISDQNVQSWLDGSLPKADKFHFLETFIRKLEKGTGSRILLDKAIERRNRFLMNAFDQVYSHARLTEHDATQIYDTFGKYRFVDGIENSPYKSIIMRFEFIEGRVVKTILCFSPYSVRELSEFHKGAFLFLEGYLTLSPMFSDKNLENIETDHAYNAQFEQWRCMLKLFRPEMQGSFFYGRAEGEIHVARSKTRTDLKSDMRLDTANSVLSPSIHHVCRDERYSHMSKKRGELVKLEYAAPKYDSNFDLIFKNCYKGSII